METELEQLSNLIGKIRADGSSRYKTAVLYKYGQGLSAVLATIYDTDKTFNITSRNIPVYNGGNTDNLRTFLHVLVNHEYSGLELGKYVKSYINSNKEYTELIKNIIDKDLKCGISVKTLNKVWPGLLKDFKSRVPLANKYKKGLCDFEKEDWYYSRKLDGVRCLCFIRGPEDITFLSRNGKEFHTLDKLRESIKEQISAITIKKPFVLDGELCIVDKDGNEDFTSIMKSIRRKNYTIPEVRYYTFGYYTIDQFYGKEPTPDTGHYTPIIKSKNIIPVIHSLIKSEEHLQEEMKTIPKEWEGLMINKYPIQFKRSNSLLKLKLFNEKEYKVIGITSGTKSIEGEQVTCVSSLTIRHNNNEVYVGSGLSDDERLQFHSNPNLIIGKWITVKYFEETKDSLRFPTFKGIRNYD